MFLTSREQKLIQTFLKRGKLTIAEMMEITDTSRRTLYRDLNNLQKSVHGVKLQHFVLVFF